MSTHNIGEAILMSTHNIGFYEDLTKIIFELSSNMHLISSAADLLFISKIFFQTPRKGYFLNVKAPTTEIFMKN